MKRTQPHVVFAGGGTGGHLFPGLAVAERLRCALPAVKITFLGTNRRVEQRELAARGFDHVALPASPLHRSLSGVARFLRNLYRGYRSARRLLLEHDTAAVVGLGGYASVPGVRAARRLGIPVLLLEQNTVPGKANRWLARAGQTVCAHYEESGLFFPKNVDFRVTGNPIRMEIAAVGNQQSRVERRGTADLESAAAPAARLSTSDGGVAIQQAVRQHAASPPAHFRRTLLVLGGSQGAHSLNDAIVSALHRRRDWADRWTVVHQTGLADRHAVAARYRAGFFTAEVVPFLADMAAAYRAADLVVCRAGGTTLAELAAVGLPAVLVPYPHAAGNHQFKNAQWYADRGAARIVVDSAQPAETAERLLAAMEPLLDSPDRREEMAARMHNLGRPHAAEQVAQLLLEPIEAA